MESQNCPEVSGHCPFEGQRRRGNRVATGLDWQRRSCSNRGRCSPWPLALSKVGPGMGNSRAASVFSPPKISRTPIPDFSATSNVTLTLLYAHISLLCMESGGINYPPKDTDARAATLGTLGVFDSYERGPRNALAAPTIDDGATNKMRFQSHQVD